MESALPEGLVQPEDTSRQALLGRMEHLLHLEEMALEHLEGCIAEQRRVLMSGDVQSILAARQKVEDATARLGQLEGARQSLAAKLIAGVSGAPGTGLWAEAKRIDQAASGRLVDARHRILGAVARIAGGNETNGLLIEGLSQTTGAAIERFGQWQPPNEGPEEYGRRRSRRRYRPVAVDTGA